MCSKRHETKKDLLEDWKGRIRILQLQRRYLIFLFLIVFLSFHFIIGKPLHCYFINDNMFYDRLFTIALSICSKCLILPLDLKNPIQNRFINWGVTSAVAIQSDIYFIFRFWQFFQCCLSEWFKMLLSKEKIVSMLCERSARTTAIVCVFLSFQDKRYFSWIVNCLMDYSNS